MPPIRRTTARKSTIPVIKTPVPATESPACSDNFSLDSELERAICDFNTKVVSPALESSSVSCDAAAGESPATPHDAESSVKKKLVKKKVKVVKTVIRKVLKKVPKGGINAARVVDHVPEIPNPSPRVSCSDSDSQAKDVKYKPSLEFENNGFEISNGVVQNEGMDVEEEIENEELLCVGRGEEEGLQERERDEDVGNDARLEEEREVKLFSGELEAMEWRKRRRTEIFVGRLDKDTKEEDIRQIFGEAGEIVDITMANDNTVKDKGCAFIRYATAEEAKLALEKFSRVKICGEFCGATPLRNNDTLYLGNIDKRWKDEDVLKMLQGIGIEKLDKVIVMVDQSKSEFNRGFAFVELQTTKDAQIAYKKLQEKDVFGKNWTITVDWAKPLTELNEEEMLKLKPSSAPLESAPFNDTVLLLDVRRQSVPSQMIGDISREEESTTQVEEQKSEGNEASMMELPHERHDTLSARSLVGFKDGSWTDEPFEDKFLSMGLCEGKRPTEYSHQPPPAKRNRCVTSGSSSAALEVMQDSIVEAPLLVLAPDHSVPSTTALKARVASLEKQRFDALKRALKAEEAKSKAEKYEGEIKKKLQEKKIEIKALKKKHKDEMKNLKREHKSALKKAEDHGFKKGKEYQLDLMKEALAFFDADFRFHDFAPLLEYIEEERQKSLEAAAQQVRSEAEHSAFWSKATEPLRSPTYASASPIHDEAIGEEEGQQEEQDEQDSGGIRVEGAG